MMSASQNLVRHANAVVGQAVFVRPYSTFKKSLGSVLRALDIDPSKEVHGVFNGKWTGNGPVVAAKSPIDGETIANVRTVMSGIYGSFKAKTELTFVYRVALKTSMKPLLTPQRLNESGEW